MKILCNLVKGYTYHELKFVDGELSLIPVTWTRWMRLANLLGIQGHHMQELLAMKCGRWFHVWLLSFGSYLENGEISFAFLSPSCKDTDATFGMISLSGYCSFNVSMNFGCIFFLLSCLLSLLNLTNSQKQTTGMKGRAILPLIFQEFSILFFCVHSLSFSM